MKRETECLEEQDAVDAAQLKQDALMEQQQAFPFPQVL